MPDRAPCFDGQSVQPWSTFRGILEPEVLFRASDIGENVRFTRISQRGVLAEVQGEGAPSWWVVDTGYYDVPPVARRVEWPDAQGEIRILDVLNDMALGCDEARCALLGPAAESDSSISPLPGHELPEAAEVSGLASDPTGDVPCAFGNSLYCYRRGTWEDAWEVEIRPGEVNRLVHASLLVPAGGIAVTGDDTLLVKQGEGWHLVETELGVAFTRSAIYGVWSAFADNGLWVTVSLAQSEGDLAMASCLQTPALIAGLPGSGSWGEGWTVVDATGVVYAQRPDETWGRVSAGPVEELVGASLVPCGDSVNALGATPTQVLSLRGPLSCVMS